MTPAALRRKTIKNPKIFKQNHASRIAARIYTAAKQTVEISRQEKAAEAAKRKSAVKEKLDYEIAFMTPKQLENLSNYARFLNWSEIIDKDDADYDENEDDGAWADLPLSSEEEKMIEESRKNGNMLTLEEFLEGL